MTRLANLADGGRRLAPLVRHVVADGEDALLLAIIPNGVPVAEAMASEWGLPIEGVRLHRDAEPRAGIIPDVTGRTIIVVDDGVETGTAARAIGRAVREAGAARVVLAVPVCPREALMDRVYDHVIAVQRPLARRDLRWHYDDFDIIDEPEALRRLAAR
jgi:predicted phosphoribosyltransferase